MKHSRSAPPVIHTLGVGFVLAPASESLASYLLGHNIRRNVSSLLRYGRTSDFRWFHRPHLPSCWRMQIAEQKKVRVMQQGRMQRSWRPWPNAGWIWAGYLAKDASLCGWRVQQTRTAWFNIFLANRGWVSLWLHLGRLSVPSSREVHNTPCSVPEK